MGMQLMFTKPTSLRVGRRKSLNFSQLEIYLVSWILIRKLSFGTAMSDCGSSTHFILMTKRAKKTIEKLTNSLLKSTHLMTSKRKSKLLKLIT